MADCLFCRIAKKEIKAEVVYEDDETLAFLDITPRAPGHTMIIPKSHAANILELDDSKLGPTLLTVKKVTGTLNKAFQQRQDNMRQQNHVSPRFLE